MRKRLIPVLLVDRHKRLVKTVQFGERTYVGDPFNVLRLFNEKEVDEICVLDIDATADGRSPDFQFLKELASECFMPLAYGGGITSVADCAELNRNGIEKFVLGTQGTNLALIHELVQHFGSQAIVVCVDVRRKQQQLTCCVGNSKLALPVELHAYCQSLQAAGVGEIILQAVDRDGLRTGYDLPLLQEVARQLTIPVVALGGAGELQHLAAGLSTGAEAVASGSAFTFIGRLRAVLISYPSQATIESLSRPLG